MPTTLAFDVYGTLINTHGVVMRLNHLLQAHPLGDSPLLASSPDKGVAFSHTWRDKQLEYSFRRGLMQRYANFAQCTRDALDYTCAHYRVPLSDTDKQGLLDQYKTLPAFDDVDTCLSHLQQEGIHLYAFSNGTYDAVDTLLRHAGIRQHFIDIISVDNIQTFKPNPATYEHFLQQAQTTAQQAWLISSNPFDIIGAHSIGMHTAWVQRSPDTVFDPWGIEPSLTIDKLTALTQQHLAR